MLLQKKRNGSFAFSLRVAHAASGKLHTNHQRNANSDLGPQYPSSQESRFAGRAHKIASLNLLRGCFRPCSPLDAVATSASVSDTAGQRTPLSGPRKCDDDGLGKILNTSMVFLPAHGRRVFRSVKDCPLVVLRSFSWISFKASLRDCMFRESIPL